MFLGVFGDILGLHKVEQHEIVMHSLLNFSKKFLSPHHIGLWSLYALEIGASVRISASFVFMDSLHTVLDFPGAGEMAQ